MACAKKMEFSPAEESGVPNFFPKKQIWGF
jgi:hypothetical protein